MDNITLSQDLISASTINFFGPWVGYYVFKSSVMIERRFEGVFQGDKSWVRSNNGEEMEIIEFLIISRGFIKHSK